MPRAAHASRRCGATSVRASTTALIRTPASCRSNAAEVGAVVGGEDDGLFADLHAVPVQEGSGTVGEHDAGAVVVGEHHGALVGAGGDDDVPGADAPHPLTADRGGRFGAEMVGTSLQRKDEAVVVVAERRGALQVQNVGIGGQFGDGVGDPVQCRPAVDGVGAAQQRAAGLALLVDEHHPRPGTGRGQGGCQTGRPRPGDQHVGVDVGRVVLGGVGDLGEPALAREYRAPPARRTVRPSWPSSMGSGKGCSIWTRPPVSSAHAEVKPRGRPSLMLVVTWCTP